MASPLTKDDRKHLRVLERRIDHLTSALDDWKGGDTGRAKAERAALQWAVSEIRNYHQSTT